MSYKFDYDFIARRARALGMIPPKKEELAETLRDAMSGVTDHMLGSWQPSSNIMLKLHAGDCVYFIPQNTNIKSVRRYDNGLGTLLKESLYKYDDFVMRVGQMAKRGTPTHWKAAPDRGLICFANIPIRDYDVEIET